MTPLAAAQPDDAAVKTLSSKIYFLDFMQYKLIYIKNIIIRQRIVLNWCNPDIRSGAIFVMKAQNVGLSMSDVAVAANNLCRTFGSIALIRKRFCAIVRSIEDGFAAEFRLSVTRETFSHRVVL